MRSKNGVLLALSEQGVRRTSRRVWMRETDADGQEYQAAQMTYARTTERDSPPVRHLRAERPGVLPPGECGAEQLAALARFKGDKAKAARYIGWSPSVLEKAPVKVSRRRPERTPVAARKVVSEPWTLAFARTSGGWSQAA
jgi:hypothetical protein